MNETETLALQLRGMADDLERYAKWLSQLTQMLDDAGVPKTSEPAGNDCVAVLSVHDRVQWLIDTRVMLAMHISAV